MPRECEWVELPDGGRALVMRDVRPRTCSIRGCQRRSDRLCDFPVEDIEFGQAPPRTCDAPMCRQHAFAARAGVDYCPTHAAVVQR